MAVRTGRWTALRQPMMVDSLLLFAKALVAAATQTVFWLVAARLQSPEVVGIAGTLISATISLGFFSLLGLNFSMVDLLPRSRTPASHVVTSLLVVTCVGVLLGGGYALVAAHVSPSLRFLGSPWLAACFAVLVGGSAASRLTESAFLILRAVPANLAVNGVLAGLLRCLLPLGLVGLGAFGLFASVGLALTVAGVLSAWLVVRRLPRPDRWLRPPEELRGAAGYAGAGYATSVLDMVPMLVLPLLVVDTRGAAANGVFYVCFQVATLLTALALAVAMSMLAEGSRHPERAGSVGRRAALILAATVSAAVALVVAGSHLLLSVFGAEYAAKGTTILVVLAVGTFGVAVNYWALMRLRIARRLGSTVVMQAVTCGSILAIAAVGVSAGLVWVAVAWGVGHLAGGVVGLVATARAVRAERCPGPPSAPPVLLDVAGERTR